MAKGIPNEVVFVGALLLVLILVAPHTSPPPVPTSQYLLVNEDFENLSMKGLVYSGNPPQQSLSGEPVRNGQHSSKYYVNRLTSTVAYRTMYGVDANRSHVFSRNNCCGARAFQFVHNQDYWIGFSVYIPANYPADNNGWGEIIYQTQAMPDSGEPFRSPMLALATDNGSWDIAAFADSRPLTTGNTFTSTLHPYHASMSGDYGRWTDWVFNVRYNYTSGKIVAWKNGMQVVNWTGPIGSNDATGPYPSFGMYKWPWNTASYPVLRSNVNITERLVYIDSFKIASAQGGYGSVAP